MTTMRFLDDLRQYSDVLRARGNAVTVRFVEPRDAEPLQNYFRFNATTRSRYNRFLGAASEPPASLLEQFIHIGEEDRFSVVASAAGRWL
jgi:hypothetical protein